MTAQQRELAYADVKEVYHAEITKYDYTTDKDRT